MKYYGWDWAQFTPRVGNTDKREREALVGKGIRLVKKNFNELGLAAFVSVPVVDRNRVIKDIVHIVPPNSPLEAFINEKENEDFVKNFETAIKDTQRWALELWDLKETRELDAEVAKHRFKVKAGIARVDVNSENSTENAVIRPDKPIFSLTTDDMAVYFTTLLKYLYKLEGVEKYKLWSKKNKDGSIDLQKRATGLKIYDEKAEEILPRDSYIGRGSGGPNIGKRMKIVSAYLLQKLGIDHNRHAKTIPINYSCIEIDFNNFDHLLLNKSSKIKNTNGDHTNNWDPDFVKEEENVEEINIINTENSDTNLEEYNDIARNTTNYDHFVDVQTNKALDVVTGNDFIQTESRRDMMQPNDEDFHRINKEPNEGENKTLKCIPKPKQKKRRRYESSDSSESSSSDSESEEELKPVKKRSRRRKTAKHFREESHLFQKTFMKMMKKTMKSMFNTHQVK